MNPWRGVPIALLGAAIGFLFSLIGLFGPVERLFHDARLLLRDPVDSGSAVCAFVTESTSRAAYGQRVAKYAGAEAIGIDVLYLDRKPDDAEFAAALSAAGNVVLATRFAMGVTEQEDPGRAEWLLPDSAPLPEGRRRVRVYSSVFAPDEQLGGAAAAAGHVNVAVDPDGKVRSIPLLIAHEGRLFPSLAMALCLHVHGRVPSDLRLSRRSIEFDDRDGATLRIPVDRDWRMLVSYARELPQFGQLWDPRVPVEGKVVLVGRTGGTGNLLSTPLWPAVEGVYVHAAALDDLLSGRFIRRPGRPWELLEIILFAVAAGLLLVRMRPWPFIAVALLLCAAPFVVGHAAFLRWGWMLPVAGPMASLACGAVLIAVSRLLERRERRRRTARIFHDGLPESTLRRLDAGPLEGVSRREISLLVLRLTGLEAAGIGTGAAAEALSLFLEAVRREVLERDGALIELSAERAVALFNAPLPDENHAQAATGVACELRATIRESILDRFEGAAAPLGLAGALHLGEVKLGVVGTRGHERFVVFGEPLREVGELLALAGSDRTLMSRAFAERVGELYESAPVDAGTGVRMLLGG